MARRKRGPLAPHVSTVEELREIVTTVREAGEFAFDVETRGNISRHPEVAALFEKEWEEKQATLKSNHPSTLQRSKQAITDKWMKDLALDPLRNDVFWLSIATQERSWAIPMGHPNGEVLVPEIRWKNELAPEGYRAILPSGKESMAKSSGFIPATFTEPPPQLSQGRVFGELETLFMDPDIPKINQNIKFDCKSVAKYFGGELPKGRWIDTQVLVHILNENLSSYNLVSIIDYLFKWDPYWRDGKVGGSVTTEPFSTVCRYAHYDARWAYMAYRRMWRRISNQGLLDVAYRDIDATSVIGQMEMNGVLIDQRAMKRLGQELQSDLNAAIMEISMTAPPGFNPNSDDDKRAFFFGKKSEGGLGLKATKKTPSGNKASVDAEVLKGLKGKHPLVDVFLEYNEVEKLKSTFVDNMPPMLHSGRLHPQFHLHRTATGRLSCVSGDTLLTTSRGTFRFDEYLPQVGDMVPTHTGRWQPVIRKIYKGTQAMVSVHLTNGSVLKCTEEHSVLTPLGWQTVGELSLGSEVYSHVGVKEVYAGPGQYTMGADGVSGITGQAHVASGGLPLRDYVSERAGDSEQARGRRSLEEGTGPSVLSLQVAREEPHVGQEWLAAPQLRGLDTGWARVPAAEGQWQVRAGASQSVCGSSRSGGTSTLARRAPHQRGQDGQLSGQPCPGDLLGAWEAPLEVATVREVATVGTMGVWDIEVAGDHSYVTHGFLNHNSSGPNLQNIPTDGRVRSLFTAEPGNSLVVADYSAIEMRIFAMFSQDPALIEIFENNIDIHTGTASVIYRVPPEEITPEQRKIGKVANFLMGYGGTAKRLYHSAGGALTMEQAEEAVEGYNTGYAGMTAWKLEELDKARRNGYVETMGGRRRRLHGYIDSEDFWDRIRAERQAINAIIQGTAAEICKDAMISMDKVLEYPKCKILIQVHDEMVTSVPTDELSIWVPAIESAMGNGKRIEGIELSVEAHYAGNWADAKG